MNFDIIKKYFPAKIQKAFDKSSIDYSKIHEIRFRAKSPIMISKGSSNLFMDMDGKTYLLINSHMQCLDSKDVFETYLNIAEHSLYSHQDEICAGFITINGGCRVGIGGKVVVQNEKITNITDISSLNFRLAKEIKGCANNIMKHLGELEDNIIIAGPPSSGKTTILRDLARQLSSGNLGEIYKVCIIDERFEIANMMSGQQSYDIGPACDVICGVPKAMGIAMAIRTLSPDIIICDEIGSKAEIDSIKHCLNSGVIVIASMHAATYDDVSTRLKLLGIDKSYNFNKIFLLANKNTPGLIREVINLKDESYENSWNSNDNSVHKFNGGAVS